MFRFKVVAGSHIHQGKKYSQGQIVACEEDLRKLFKEKFVLMKPAEPEAPPAAKLVPTPVSVPRTPPPAPPKAPEKFEDEDEDEAPKAPPAPKPTPPPLKRRKV